MQHNQPELGILIAKQVEAGQYEAALTIYENNDLDTKTLSSLLNAAFFGSTKLTHWKHFMLRALKSFKKESFFESIEHFIQRNKDGHFQATVMILTEILAHCDESAIINKIIERSIADQNIANCFIKALPSFQRVNPKACAKVITQMALLCGQACNFVLLFDLSRFDRKNTDEGMYSLAPFDLTKAKYALALGEEERKLFTKRLSEFAKEFGKVTYEGALLAFAAIRAKKPYDVNPTILRHPRDSGPTSEFKTYLDILKNAPRPVQERFIIAGAHWISGEIQIDNDNQVNILFIDSLALDTALPHPDRKEHKEEMFLSTQESIKTFAQVFPDQSIYFSDEVKQHSGVGCSIFALDDTRHLFTVERYLPAKYQTTNAGESKPSKGLFAYLADSNKRMKDPIIMLTGTTGGIINIKRCHLPLSLMRGTQSRTLFTKFIPDRTIEEQIIPVNKAGKKASDSAEAHQVTVTRARRSTPASSEEGDGKPTIVMEEVKQNRWIDDKFGKMGHDVAKLLMQNDEESIQLQAQHFILESLKERVDSRKTEKINITIKSKRSF